MNSTALIINSTKKATKKTTKKTTKKEYLFSPDVWRIIMSYVGTPQQFIDKHKSFIENGGYKLYGALGRLRYPMPKAVPIQITQKEYEYEGIKNQYTAGLWVDILAFSKAEQEIRGGVWMRIDKYDRTHLQLKIGTVYSNEQWYLGAHTLKGTRILKILVPKSIIDECNLEHRPDFDRNDMRYRQKQYNRLKDSLFTWGANHIPGYRTVWGEEYFNFTYIVVISNPSNK